MRSNWAVVVLLILMAVAVLKWAPKGSNASFEGPFQVTSLPDPK